MDLKAVIYGLGPIGQLIAKTALDKGFEIVGAIDIDPQKVGKDLGELLKLGKTLGVKIERDADKVLQETKPDVVLHATATWLDKVYPQILRAIKAEADVVSTCETLAYPWYRYPELAELLDNYAKIHNVTVLGSGINPGFIFDAVPAFLTVTSAKLRRIKVVRALDAAKRRYSFQKKIGLGMTPEEFKKKLEEGEITAHVGYAESVLLIADMLGIKLDEVKEGQEPVIAEKDYETEYFKIKPGHVKGIIGYGIGYKGGEEIIKLDLRCIVGYEGYEEIVIEGEPTLTWRATEIPGDLATAAIIVNLAPKVIEARPGLITIKDLIKYTY